MTDLPEERASNTGNVDGLIGTSIDGKYTIEEKLGSGASSTVYRAVDNLLNRQVAVKVLHSHLLEHERARERFLQESTLVAALEHPSIIKVFSRGSLENGQLYIIMDYVEGETLAQMLGRVHKLDRNQFRNIFMQILDGLDVAHKNSVVHRDLKPGNIVLAKGSDEIQAKILDFGIAKNIDLGSAQSKTATGIQLGSSAYMSPEQCQAAAVDGRSDLYSLGCVMYECLTGEAPFSGGSDMEVMYKQLHNTITSSERLAAVPVEFRSFIARALQKDPAARYQSAREMKDALQACKDVPVKQKKKLLPLITALVSLLVLLALVPLGIKYGAKRESGKSDNAFEKIRNATELKKYLDKDKADPAQKIQFGLAWTTKHPADSKSDLRDLGLAQEYLADYAYSIQAISEAYALLGLSIKNNDTLNGNHRLLLMRKRANLALKLGATEQAMRLFEELLRACKDDEPNRRSCLREMAECAVQIGDLPLARQYIDESIADYAGDFNDEYYARQAIYCNILSRQKEFDQVEKIAIRMMQQMKDHPAGLLFADGARLQFNLSLAQVAVARKQLPLSEHYYLEAIKLQRKLNLHDPLLQLELLEMYLRTGQDDKAKKIAEQMAASAKPAFGLSAYVTTRVPLARWYYRRKQFDKAIRESLDILDTFRRSPEQKMLFPGAFRSYLEVFDPLFASYVLSNRTSEFRALAEKNIEDLPKASIERAAWTLKLGDYYSEISDYANAEKWYREAISALDKAGALDHLGRMQLQMRLAQTLVFGGKVDDAEALTNATIKGLEALPSHHEDMAMLKRVAAGVADKKTEWAKAIALREDAIRLLKTSPGDEAARLATCSDELGNSLRLAGRLEEAAAAMEKAGQISSRAPMEEFKEGLPIFFAHAASVYADLGNNAKVDSCLQQLEAGLKKNAATKAVIYTKIDLAQIKYSFSQIEEKAAKRKDNATVERLHRLENMVSSQSVNS